MVVTDLHHRIKRIAVVGIGDLGFGITDAGYRNPVHSLDFELVANQIVRVADDHAVIVRIKIDNVTRPRGSARQSPALTDGEQLDPVVLADKVAVHIVNLATMKFSLAKMRTQKRFVIVPRHEANFLTVDFVGRLQSE